MLMKTVVVFGRLKLDSTKGLFTRFLSSVVFGTSLACAVGFSPAVLCANDANVRLANLTQDLELLSRQVAGLRSEVEILRRENTQLRLLVEQGSKSKGVSQSKLVDFGRQMDSQLAEVRREVAQSNANAKILKQHVDSSLQKLIQQMNTGFSAIRSNPVAAPEAPAVVFNDEYPKERGFVHKVGKGETVSSIAKKHNSKVSWIINANRISDPTKVHVGKELFVPQQ